MNRYCSVENRNGWPFLNAEACVTQAANAQSSRLGLAPAAADRTVYEPFAWCSANDLVAEPCLRGRSWRNSPN